MKEIRLYKGNNGTQDFWESEDSRLLIFRNHADKLRLWFTTLEGKTNMYFANSDLDAVLSDIQIEHGIKAILHKAKHWISKEGKENMVLEWAYVL